MGPLLAASITRSAPPFFSGAADRDPAPVAAHRAPDASSRPPLLPMQEGGGNLRMDGRIAAVAVALAASALGCAGSAWRHARSEDTIAAYHAFLKDYPDSRFSDQARARLELARIKKRPTRSASRRFARSTRLRSCSPSSIRSSRSSSSITRVRWVPPSRTGASSNAIRAARSCHAAAGNLAYLENEGFGGDVQALARFADEHPASDYARGSRAKRSRDCSCAARPRSAASVSSST